MARARNLLLAAAGISIGLWGVGPAAADGLERFEKSIKPQLPPDTLTYKSSKALGDSGFVLEDVTVTTPSDPGKDKSTPIQIKRITVEDLDFPSIEKQAPPLFAKLRVEGISSGANPAAGIDLKQLAGLDNLSADFQLDYRLDTDRKTFTLNRMELTLNELARLELSLVLDGVTLDNAANANASMNDDSLRTASLVYDDHSLLAKAIPIAAAFQGMDPKAMIDMAKGVLDGARAGQGPKATAAIDSLVAYLEDYQKPKGELRITLNPPAKVSSADLSNAKTADDMVKLLGLAVSYPGTRSSTPGEAPATPPAAPPAAAPPATPPAADAAPPAAEPGTTKKADEEKDNDDDDDKAMDKKK